MKYTITKGVACLPFLSLATSACFELYQQNQIQFIHVHTIVAESRKVILNIMILFTIAVGIFSKDMIHPKL